MCLHESNNPKSGSEDLHGPDAISPGRAGSKAVVVHQLEEPEMGDLASEPIEPCANGLRIHGLSIWRVGPLSDLLEYLQASPCISNSRKTPQMWSLRMLEN